MDDRICQSLKEARENAGLTQKQVEGQLGLRSLMMRDYETGRLKLPVDMAVRLASLYRVSLDELVGVPSELTPVLKSRAFSTFHALFLGGGFNLIFSDPIMRAFLEDLPDPEVEQSFFDLLVSEVSEKKKKEMVVETVKFLFSLAGRDSKVSDLEINSIGALLGSFQLRQDYDELVKFADKAYLPVALPPSLEGIEVRHFVVWVLFFFAFAGKQATIEELSYIEKVAEVLRVNRSNFLEIKKHFVEEAI